MQIKLLVETPVDTQELITIHSSGGYYDESKVLWDERKDGKFPSNMKSKVGGLVRSGKKINVNNALLSKRKNAKSAKDKIEKDGKDIINFAKSRIHSLDLKSIDPALRDIVIILRELV